ncbi:helix-turn-helix domain-containing protein [Microbacterium sp. TPD7012]|uniref:helix-turn-helix domain-containing protein n=1 Tax=Microbacterium sp. TPD7012 TaxID=2171975 RepID=UPI000D509F99|nr:helix-turn-helix domain-containing protein [Microbacterium sp. TPD7012]PVE95009.1 hypothetical protein DC434_13880 [Microbacterium sp. TPD7012]
MGFKNSEWAYSLALPPSEKAVLVAIAHRASDKTGETFVGRNAIAEMAGCASRTVTRALDSLEHRGAIKRKERRRRDGYRDTDLLVIDTSWTLSQGTESQVTDGHLTDSQVTLTTTSGDTDDSLRGQSVQASSKELDIHEVTGKKYSDELIDTELTDPSGPTFDDFWVAWPRKVKKPHALRAWGKAIKRASPEDIVAAAISYRDNPGRPETRFIPHPATWLNADSWNDALEDNRDRGGKQTPLQRAQQTIAAGQSVVQQRQTYGNITTLNPKGITA